VRGKPEQSVEYGDEERTPLVAQVNEGVLEEQSEPVAEMAEEKNALAENTDEPLLTHSETMNETRAIDEVVSESHASESVQSQAERSESVSVDVNENESAQETPIPSAPSSSTVFEPLTLIEGMFVFFVSCLSKLIHMVEFFSVAFISFDLLELSATLTFSQHSQH
jgi:hypothetical protein